MKKVLDRSAVQVKKVGGVREGRGFSLNELKDAKMNTDEARDMGLPVDIRRKSNHPDNVKSLKALKKKKK